MSDTLLDKWTTIYLPLGGFSIYQFINGELVYGLLIYKTMEEAQEHCDKLNA